MPRSALPARILAARILGGLLVTTILAALLFPLFAQAKTTSGMGKLGSRVRSHASRLVAYYNGRPSEKVRAYTNRPGAGASSEFIGSESVEMRGYEVRSGKSLAAAEVKFHVPTRIVGRVWKEIKPNEIIFEVTAPERRLGFTAIRKDRSLVKTLPSGAR